MHIPNPVKITMVHLMLGILIVILVLIIALWARNPVVNGLAIGGLLVFAGSALSMASDGPDGGYSGGKAVDTTTASAVDTTTASTEPTDTKPADSAATPTKSPTTPADSAATPVASTKVASRTDLRQALSLIVRNSKKGLIAALAGSAAAASLGAGGDTIVEIVSIAIDSSLYLAQLAAIFATGTGEVGATLQKIWKLDFKGGPQGIVDAMQAIVATAGGPSTAVFAQMRGVFLVTMGWLSDLLGNVVSICIPDDASLTGWILSEAIRVGMELGKVYLFAIGSTIYSSFPKSAQDVLQQPEQLKVVAEHVLKLLEKYLVGDGTGSWVQKMASTLTMSGIGSATAAGLLLLNPILMFPVAGTVFIGSQIATAAYATTGLGKKQLSAILQGLYMKKLDIAGVGQLTSVEAMIMLIQKVTVLSFAGMYILSDQNITPDTTIVNDIIGQAKSRPKKRSNAAEKTPAAAASVGDAADAQLITPAANDATNI